MKQACMLKLKRFEDDEATVEGVEPLQHNNNEAFLDERGYTKRSSHKDNKTQSDMLGSFVVRNKENVVFKIGTGLTEQQRREFWNDRVNLKGKLVKYKFFPVGIKEAPRHPVFLGFRERDDM